MKKWVITAAMIFVAYVAWRKYGSNVKGAISSVTA
jgi:hypothetical protein